MRTYRTLEIITIHGGLVGMTDEQYRRRSHLVKVVDKKRSIYEIVQPVCFKAGEVIGLNDPSKADLSRMEDLDAIKEVEVAEQAEEEKRNEENAANAIKQAEEEKPKRGRKPKAE